MIWRLKCLLLAATPFRYSVITGSAGFVGGAHTQGKRQGVSARQARELRQAAAGRAAESSQGRGHSRQTLVTAAPTVVRAIAIRGAGIQSAGPQRGRLQPMRRPASAARADSQSMPWLVRLPCLTLPWPELHVSRTLSIVNIGASIAEWLRLPTRGRTSERTLLQLHLNGDDGVSGAIWIT